MTRDDPLNAVLLPLGEERLLLPHRAIADALPTQALLPPSADAPPWCAGRVVWQDIELPVLRFEQLNGGGAAALGARARIVMIDGIGARFGLLCDGHPQLLSLQRAAVEPAPARPSDSADLVLARVRVEGRDALIPDLAAIEARLTTWLDAAPEIAATS